MSRQVDDRPSAELISWARRQASLTQAELADQLGTTQSAVSRWERGHDEPRWSTFAAILRACGLRASVVVDDAVDRAQIRAHLALTPVQRLAAVTNVARFRDAAHPVAAGR